MAQGIPLSETLMVGIFLTIIQKFKTVVVAR
jgi:hypothetical protein